MIVRLSLRFCVFNLNETRSFSANCADIVRRVQQTRYGKCENGCLKVPLTSSLVLYKMHGCIVEIKFAALLLCC